MFCCECGKPVNGKFCSHCGTPVVTSLGATATATAPAAVPVNIPVTGPAMPPSLPATGSEPANWETEHRYEALIQVPHIRETIERHTRMAKKGVSADEINELSAKLMFHGAPIHKLAPLMQPLYSKFGMGTGKERTQEFDLPIGRVMFRMLCSLARHGQLLRGVRQGTDGCEFEAMLPSDFRSFEGEVHVTVRRGPNTVRFQTQVAAAAKIRGQLFDWGKSRNCLEELFADLQLDPG
jgi:hypothetical protein